MNYQLFTALNPAECERRLREVPYAPDEWKWWSDFDRSASIYGHVDGSTFHLRVERGGTVNSFKWIFYGRFALFGDGTAIEGSFRKHPAVVLSSGALSQSCYSS